MPLILSGSAGLSGNVGNVTKDMLPAGSVLQVVHSILSSNTTATSVVDSGLLASITPTSAANKILVLVTQPFSTYNASAETGNWSGFSIWRNNDLEIFKNRSAAGRYTLFGVDGLPSANHQFRGVFSAQVLDAPNTTSAVIYKTKISGYSSAQITTPGSEEAQVNAYITLMEIKA